MKCTKGGLELRTGTSLHSCISQESGGQMVRVLDLAPFHHCRWREQTQEWWTDSGEEGGGRDGTGERHSKSRTVGSIALVSVGLIFSFSQCHGCTSANVLSFFDISTNKIDHARPLVLLLLNRALSMEWVF